MSGTKANFEIPGYTLLSRIGHGATATVWLAEQHALHRKVAIKVPHTFADEDSRITKRFMREAVTVAQLDHPGIVAIHDFGRTEDGHFYYVMPYLDNGDLRSLDWRDDDHYIEVFSAICDALAYAHDHKVIHRDLKPENILLSSQGQPLIADFGIALTPMGDARITRDGLTVGSCYYMSPEQARSREIDGRSDIYSVGVVLFEMLVGRVPYDAPDEFSVLLMHANDPLPEMPESLYNWAGIVRRCMAKDPGGRYRDARALRRAIQNVRRRPAAAETLEHPVLTSKHGRWRGIAVGVGLALSLGALLLLSLPLGQGPEPNPGTTGPATEQPSDDPAVAASSVHQPDLDKAAAVEKASQAPLQGQDEVRDQRLADQLGVNLQPRPDARQMVLEEVTERLVAALDTRDFSRAIAEAESLKAALALEELREEELRPYLQPHLSGWRESLLKADRRLDAQAAQGLARVLAALNLLDDELVAPAWRADQLPRAGTRSRDSLGIESVVVPPVVNRPGAGLREIDRAFSMTRREISRALYARFVAETSARNTECTRPGNTVPFIRKNYWHDPGIEQDDSHPAVCMNYADVLAFIDWLNDETGEDYRLPTENQWLQAAWVDDVAATACRSGNVADQSAVSAGGRGRRFDCDDGYRGTAPTGRFVANRLGVHDLRGNVREWTRSCAREIPEGGQLLDAVGIRDAKRCDWRVVRGTSWWDGRNRSMIEFREEMPAEKAYAHVGIRLVQELQAPSD